MGRSEPEAGDAKRNTQSNRNRHTKLHLELILRPGPLVGV